MSETLNIDIKYILTEPGYIFDDEHLELIEFFKMYDNWKDVFGREEIIEEYYYGRNFNWFIQKNDTYYVDKDGIETQGDIEYNFIGFCIFGEYDSLMNKCIEYIWLNEEYRGQGLGRKMVELSEVEYYDNAINDSLGFWKKMGLQSRMITGKDGIVRLNPNILLNELKTQVTRKYLTGQIKKESEKYE
tara:strand:- start:695 stop:1258 length:564 start_codon:yes stop_codon:yes gene_type:complete